MTLRTAIFMELWAYKVCSTCSERSTGEDRGTQTLPSFTVKGKKMIVSTVMGGQENIVFN